MDPRRADVAVTYNGKNATVQLAPLLASFTYKDVASGSSDSISMELNDRDHQSGQQHLKNRWNVVE